MTRSREMTAVNVLEFEYLIMAAFHHFKEFGIIYTLKWQRERKWHLGLALLQILSLSCLTFLPGSWDKTSSRWQALICWYQVIWISGKDVLDFYSMWRSLPLSLCHSPSQFSFRWELLWDQGTEADAMGRCKTFFHMIVFQSRLHFCYLFKYMIPATPSHRKSIIL